MNFIVDQKIYIKEKECFLYFLFLLVIGLTLVPFFKIGFTTGDDLQFYETMRRGDIWEDAYWYARGAGRFYFLITKPLYHLPYIIDNFYFTKIIQYGFLLLSFVLFTKVVQKIFKLKEFTFLLFLLLFICLTVTPNNFVPIISYPFFFTCSFSFFLLSLLRLFKYYEFNKNKYLIQSVILFTLALLFYETYLIFLVFLVGFIFVKNLNKYGKKTFKTKSFYKEILSFCSVGVLYLVIYFTYRWFFQTEEGFYNGSSFAKEFNISNFFKILINYNKSAIPTYVYYTNQGIMEANSILEGGHRNNFWYILTNSQASSVAKSIIQSFLFFILAFRIKPEISWKKLGVIALISVILTFSVHLFLAISDKYNTTNWHTHDGYVTTFFSFFTVTLIFALIIYAFIKVCYNKKWLKHSIISVFTLFIFFISVIISYSNDHLSKDWQHSQNRFTVMDELLKEKKLNNFPDNSIFYAEELNNTVSSLGSWVCDYSSDWGRYIYLKTGKKLNIAGNIPKFKRYLEEYPDRELYYISKYENSKNFEMLMVISKLERNNMDFDNEENIFQDITSKESTIHYYSPFKNFSFEFFIPEVNDIAKVLINETELDSINFGSNSIRINNKNKKQKITSFVLKSSVSFCINSFAISTTGYIEPENKTIDL